MAANEQLARQRAQAGLTPTPRPMAEDIRLAELKRLARREGTQAALRRLREGR